MESIHIAAFSILGAVVLRLWFTTRKLEMGIAITARITGAFRAFATAVANCPAESCPTKKVAKDILRQLDADTDELEKTLTKKFNRNDL
jgi:hypothetical protein